MASARDLPRRLAASIGGSIDAAGDLPETQRELLEHLRSIDTGIQALTVAVLAMQADIEALTARSQRLERLIAHIDEQIPDPDAPSPIAKAKDALLGEDSG